MFVTESSHYWEGSFMVCNAHTKSSHSWIVLMHKYYIHTISKVTFPHLETLCRDAIFVQLMLPLSHHLHAPMLPGVNLSATSGAAPECRPLCQCCRLTGRCKCPMWHICNTLGWHFDGCTSTGSIWWSMRMYCFVTIVLIVIHNSIIFQCPNFSLISKLILVMDEFL